MNSNQTYPHGSAPWMVTEQDVVNQFMIEEVENFSFKVRNQMDWLNGHMEEIFAPGNVNVLNTFKTPGKLRGRTPYTAKKRANQLNRAPLTDIFAPNPQAASPLKSPAGKSALTFNIVEDVENREPYRLSPPKPISQPATTRPLEETREENAQSEAIDQMEIDSHPEEIIPDENHSPPEQIKSPIVIHSHIDRRRSTNETFVSAEETLKHSQTTSKFDSQATVPDEQPIQVLEEPKFSSDADEVVSDENNLPTQSPRPEIIGGGAMDIEDVQSPSDASSPLKPLLRKSSLTFAALPGREPFAKSSFGARTSHFDTTKSFGGRASQMGRATGSRITGGPSQGTASITAIEKGQAEMEVDETEATRLYNKTSTQRLHDKINMLGQSRDIRTSKSQHLNTTFEKSLYPQISSTDADRTASNPASKPTTKEYISQDRSVVHDDEDWIMPITRVANEASHISQSKESQFVDQVANKLACLDGAPLSRLSPSKPSPSRPYIHKKMQSTIELDSPSKSTMAPDLTLQKPISVSNPTPALGIDRTTTPVGSPPRSPSGRRLLDGPLSASKAKFYSVLKSAKGIFAMSAGASASAKIEAFSPGRSKRLLDDQLLSPTAEVRASPALYPSLPPPRMGSPTHAPASPSAEPRRTRSSTEQRRKEEEMKKREGEREKASNHLEKAREQERQKVAAIASSKMNQVRPVSKLGANRPGAVSRTDTASSKDTDDDNPPPPPPKTMLPTTQAQRLREQRRVPVPRSNNKDGISKTKPAPVTLRMPSQRIGHGAPSNALLNQSLHDSLPPPPPPKNSTTKTSGLTTHPNSSTASIRTNVTSAKRALDAAAKKKEQELKVAQRKAEQKREMDSKRAQRLEEEKRLEQQRKVAEQQRVQEAKRVAKQSEDAKRAEQQRKEAQRPVSRQNNFTNALQQEQSRPQQVQRGDIGGAKPLSKVNLVHDPPRPVVQINPAKPPKRVMQFDDDVPSQRPPVQRNGPSYQQLDAKRRKTEDEEETVEQQRRSVMAPPVRHSTMKKETSKYPHQFLSAHAGNQHHQNPSMFVKTVTAQHIQQTKALHQNEMSKYANGRIPFADNANPPAASQPSSQQQHKTPLRAGPQSAKKSPFYPNPDSIELPEIATDSEEDEDEDFVQPDWVASPLLRQALQNQQLVDPMEIFGPIEPLRMDDVFRNKERQKKFRDRTSSANWGGADALTEQERARDKRARERLMADGGWDMRGQKDAMGGSPYQ